MEAQTKTQDAALKKAAAKLVNKVKREVEEGRRGRSTYNEQAGVRRRSPLEYSKYGRMTYNPHWHYRHGKRMSVAELAYIAQSYSSDTVKSLALDIGRTCKTVRTCVSKLRREELWDVYLTIDTSKFLEQLEEEERAFLERTGFVDITEESDDL